MGMRKMHDRTDPACRFHGIPAKATAPRRETTRSPRRKGEEAAYRSVGGNLYHTNNAENYLNKTFGGTDRVPNTQGGGSTLRTKPT